jgi:peptide/nickel transport system substrate-binding protein
VSTCGAPWRSCVTVARAESFSLPLAGAVLLLALAACDRANFSSPPAHSAVVRVATPAHVVRLDPRLGWSYYPAQAGRYVFEGLTRTAEDGSLVPSLARSWTAFPGGRRFLFHLRTGVTFHDGTPFTAHDVVRAWEAALAEPPDSLTHAWMLDPLAGAAAFARGEQEHVSGVTVPNDSTLGVELTDPLAFFPVVLSHPQAAIPAVASTPTRPIGTGPWRFVSLDSSEIRFAANDGYWDGRPALDSLLYRYVPDSLTVRAFEAGWVDVAAELSNETRIEWSTRPDIGFVESEAVAATRLVINMREPAFQDVRVRRGLNHAINAARLAQATAAASAVRAAGAIPPSLAGSDPQREPYAFKPGLARRLIAEGGYPPDRPLRLWVPSPGLSDFPPQSGSLLRDYLEAVGFRVELTVQTEGIDTALSSRAADLELTVWVGDYPDGDAFLYPLYHSQVAGSAGNDGAYGNPEVDHMIDASRRELDPARRAQLLRAADRLVFDDAPIVFLWFTRTATAYSLRLAGWGRDPQMSRLFHLRLASTVTR